MKTLPRFVCNMCRKPMVATQFLPYRSASQMPWHFAEVLTQFLCNCQEPLYAPASSSLSCRRRDRQSLSRGTGCLAMLLIFQSRAVRIFLLALVVGPYFVYSIQVQLLGSRLRGPILRAHRTTTRVFSSAGSWLWDSLLTTHLSYIGSYMIGNRLPAETPTGEWTQGMSTAPLCPLTQSYFPLFQAKAT